MGRLAPDSASGRLRAWGPCKQWAVAGRETGLSECLCCILAVMMLIRDGNWPHAENTNGFSHGLHQPAPRGFCKLSYRQFDASSCLMCNATQLQVGEQDIFEHRLSILGVARVGWLRAVKSVGHA